MNQNSSLFKGWAVTLTAAILALVRLDKMNPWYLLIGLIPAFAFWCLDGFSLWQERLYRQHYDAVRLASLEEWSRDPFSMHVHGDPQGRLAWLKACFSASVAVLYVALVLLSLGLATVLSIWGWC